MLLFNFEGLSIILIQEKINHERLKPLPVSQPKEFQLSVNFRSHAGIVQCAFSVITLLRKLWPDSIDALSAEEGIIDGKKPIFYTRSGSDTANSTVGDSLFTPLKMHCLPPRGPRFALRAHLLRIPELR